MIFRHSTFCSYPHNDCSCLALEAMLEWSDREAARVSDGLEATAHAE